VQRKRSIAHAKSFLFSKNNNSRERR